MNSKTSLRSITQESERNSIVNNIKLLFKYISPYKWQVFRNVGYNVLSAFFALFTYTLVIPFLRILFGIVPDTIYPGVFEWKTEYILDLINYYFNTFITEHGQIPTLMLVSAIVIIASLLKNGCVFMANNSMAFLRAGTVRDLRRKLYEKILRLQLSYFTDSRKGDVLTRISNDVQEVELSVMSSLTMLFRDPLYILIFLIYLMIVSTKLTIFALILLPISGWLIGKASKTLKSASFAGQQNLGRLLSIVEETLTGLRIIKGFNAEVKMEAQFKESNEKYAKIFKRVTRKGYLASPLSEFLATIVIMVIMYFGAILTMEGSMTADKLIVFIMVFSQIIPHAKNITTGYFNIQKGMASIDRIDVILDAEEKIIEKEDAVKITEFSDCIEFKNVWFSYNSEAVLKDINLKIKKGQTVAIVGKSGGGKSTLVDLIPRFMDPEKGQIFVDGHDIRDLKVKDLRHLMGIVSQHPILFNTTFFNNIAFGVDTATLPEVESAARIANAHDFITETEEGYENTVGESGNKLSGGQRQRISIARAIMANPPILILDEATSALDTESERLVQDAILKLMKNRTSIIIAHRLSTIQHADIIIVIEDGVIVEQGTHSELIAKDEGFYRKLHSFQAI